MCRHLLLACLLFLLSLPPHASAVDEGVSPDVVKAASSAPTTKQNEQTVTEFIKDVVQIAFWLTVSGVTILTYLKARHTLLQPIRTEVFKLQIEEVKQVFKIFIGKGEAELTEYFGFNEMVNLNGIALMDEFVHIYFSRKPPDGPRPYDACTSKFVSMAAAKTHLRLVDSPRAMIEEMEKQPNELPKREDWNDYTFAVLHLPATYTKRMKRIEQLTESPMLPIGCVELLNNFKKNLEDNAQAVMAAFTEAAKKLPEYFPTTESLKVVDLMWLGNVYNSKAQKLKPNADKIVAFIRAHFGVDMLLKDS